MPEILNIEAYLLPYLPQALGHRGVNKQCKMEHLIHSSCHLFSKFQGMSPYRKLDLLYV